MQQEDLGPTQRPSDTVYQKRALAEWQGDLQDLDPQVRRKAVEALGRFGSRAVPALSQASHDADAFTRLEAISALKRIGLAAVPALIEILQDTTYPERRLVAAALGEMGPTAKDAVPHLIRGLTDTDPSLRTAVIEALGQIGPPANDAVPALVLAMRDTDSTMRRAVGEALKKIGPAPRAAIPALAQALRDPNPEVKEQAAEALGRLGPTAKIGVPLLKQATRDPSSVVRSSAKGALKHISPEWAAEKNRIIISRIAFSIVGLALLSLLGNLRDSQQSRFRSTTGDRLINVNNGVDIGVVVRMEDKHTFPNGVVGRAYTIRGPDDVEMDMVADRLEEIARVESVRSTAPYRTKNGSYYGCLTRAALDRAVDLQVDEDKVAFGRLLGTGVCFFLKPSVPVFVVEHDFQHNVVQIRQEGQLGTAWTFGEAIEMVR